MIKSTTLSYFVFGKLFRKKGDYSDLIEISEFFYDPNPIIAREKAFEEYQNLVNILLLSIGKDYESHNKAIEDLHYFLTPYRDENSKKNKAKDEIDKEIGLFINVSEEVGEDDDEKEEYSLIDMRAYNIHKLTKETPNLETEFYSLLDEYRIYKQEKFDTKDYIKTYNLGEPFEEVDLVSILDSPFDFSKVLSCHPPIKEKK